MESGTPHSGWNTTERMLAENTAVGVSGLPTTILRRMDDLALLVDARHELRDVVPTWNSPRCSGIQRQRSMLTIEALRLRADERGLPPVGLLHAAIERGARARRQHARGLDVVLLLERLARASCTSQVVDVLRAARQRQAEALAQQRDVRMLAAELEVRPVRQPRTVVVRLHRLRPAAAVPPRAFSSAWRRRWNCSCLGCRSRR